jgi:hypothetical protein
MEETPRMSAKRALLDKLLRGEITHIQSRIPAVERYPITGPAPLSYNQEHIYLQGQLVDRVAPASRPHNETITIHRTGLLDLKTLERSLVEILRRHEAWRTTFERSAGTLVQSVHSTAELDFEVVDLQHVSEPEIDAVEMAEKRAQQRFDLARGPLVRFQLIRLREQEYRLFVAAHQIVLDGVSAYHIFLPELVMLYEAFACGQPSPLPEPTIQYSDYAQWQRRTLANGELSKHLNYWQSRMGDGVPVLRMPTDHPRPKVQSFRGSIQPFAMSKTLSEAAKALSKAHGNTLFVTLLATFALLLKSYADQEHIAIGTVAPTRSTDALPLLGYFLNPVLLYLQLTGDPTFRELLVYVREVVLGALSHAHMPFHLLVAAVESQTDESRHPLFQAQISLEPPIPNAYPGWDLTPMDLQTGGAKLDLYFVFDDRPAGMLGRVQYNPDLFRPATVECMIRDYQSLLAAAIAGAENRISQFPRYTFPA